MSVDRSRRSFIGASAAAMAAGMAAVSGALEAEPAAQTQDRSGTTPLTKRPNIILFMPDELRADSLACYGNPIIKTPNIDRLASEGTRFANCHAQYPVCGASRCSMLTGWPTSVRGHRSLYYFLRPEEPNLFRYLKRSGYDVFWYGKNDALAAQTFADSLTEWLTPTGAHSRSAPVNATPGVNSMLYGPSGDRTTTSDYAVLQAATKIIERKESERPFFLFLPMINPHPPYTICPDFYNMYAPTDVAALVPPGLPKKPRFHAGIRSRYGLDKLDDASLRKIRAVYYGQVSYIDWLLGELMATLEKTGRDKDTALFLLSDHGDYAGDFGLIEKWPSGLEDCLTHVPLIGRVPGGKPGVVAEDMIELYDIMQTCLEVGGTPSEHTHFSRSLTAQLSGHSGDPDRAVFCEGGYNVYEPQCVEPMRAGMASDYVNKIRLQNEDPQTVSRSAMVRTRDYKLIVRPQGQSELYSYRDDPLEKNNLFGEGRMAGIQTNLQNELLRHYIETTGIAPMDKDSRDVPPFYPTNMNLTPSDWQRTILDEAGHDS